MILYLLGMLGVAFLAWRFGIKHGAIISYDTLVLPLRTALVEIRELSRHQKPGPSADTLGNIAGRALQEQQRILDATR